MTHALRAAALSLIFAACSSPNSGLIVVTDAGPDAQPTMTPDRSKEMPDDLSDAAVDAGPGDQVPAPDPAPDAAPELAPDATPDGPPALLDGPVMAPPFPNGTIWQECEMETGMPATCGTWTWVADGSRFSADWGNGAHATIELLDRSSTNLVLRRVDRTGASTGLTADYSGTIGAHEVSGTVNWSDKGHTWSGTWKATF
jgi:hypothetical protein